MYCPEDGRHIPCPDFESVTSIMEYPPCSWCGTTYVYDGAEGCYRVQEKGHGPTQNPISSPTEDLFEALGRERRQMGEDALVHHLLDTLKDEAHSAGTSTYLLSIAGGEVTHKLEVRKHVGRDYSYVEYEGDHWLPITRDRALQVLAERRHHD